MTMMVSEEAHDTTGFKEWVLAFSGKNIKPPIRTTYLPNEDFVEWHVREVFQGPWRI